MRRIVSLMALFAAQPAEAAPLRMHCTVSGEKLLVPAVAPSQVCERMRAALGKATGLALRLNSTPLSPADQSWMRVTLRFTRSGIASARLETASHGRVTMHPDVNIGVSDRAMDLGVVDNLARELAKRVDGGAWRG